MTAGDRLAAASAAAASGRSTAGQQEQPQPEEGAGARLARRCVRILGLGGSPQPRVTEGPRYSKSNAKGCGSASASPRPADMMRGSKPMASPKGYYNLGSASPSPSPPAIARRSGRRASGASPLGRRQSALRLSPRQKRRPTTVNDSNGSNPTPEAAAEAACRALPVPALKRLVAKLQQSLLGGQDELIVTKKAEDPMGVNCDAETLRLEGAIDGSAADVCGARAFVGRMLTHVNDECVGTMGQVRQHAKGRSVVVLRFASAEAGDDNVPQTAHSDPLSCSAREETAATPMTPLDDSFDAANTSAEADESVSHGPRTLRGVKKYILDNFGIHPEDLVVNSDKVLGTGSFGKVIRGDYQATEVAVKVQRTEKQLTQNEIDEWKKEVKIMTRLRHPNVLMLLGACFEEGRLMIITELCDQGTLRQYLRKHKQRQTPFHYGQKVDWCIQISKGMAYLHHKRIHHRDLKPANIFVSCGMMKVADFGLSKLRRATHREPPQDFARTGNRDSSRNSWAPSQFRDSFALPSNMSPRLLRGRIERDAVTGDRLRVTADGRRAPASNSEASIPGTFAFIAPEVWQEEPFTDASDVYSFGVTCIEIFTYHVPFDEDTGADCSWRIMTGRSRPQLPRELRGCVIPDGIRSIVTSCVDFDKDCRSCFVDVVKRLRAEREKEYIRKREPAPPHDCLEPGMLSMLQIDGPSHPKCRHW
eukprot:TRINITY_DN6185_c6_g1_i1.p1 TRINITY_DN6185_c6_g1~~TRINITY_DN6185_c6_g1_i1.p1  ORF type:complete len:771 (+),score=239.28 TRINITY_DN6185_c6_g1_i1:203-2314(+)